MRDKESILNDAGISSIGMMSELELEVLIDIRDIHYGLLIESTRIVDRLIDTNSNLPFGGI